MRVVIDLDAILTPIPGDNPAGEDLRYTPIYDDIREARRADDPLDRGEWQREIKTSDWDRVIALSVEALVEKTKDLQIAAWLAEALTMTSGFSGLLTGLKLLAGLLTDFWDRLYPEIEDDDLDYRVGPIEFMSEKLADCVKQIPLTDGTVTPGYSWVQWQESLRVGYEKDTINQHGNVDENKRQARNELIAEGKLTAEDFDFSVAASSRAFYESLAKNLKACQQEFEVFDQALDEKFGSEAPRVSEIRQAMEECHQVVMRILKQKRASEPDSEPEAESAPEAKIPEPGIQPADQQPQEFLESTLSPPPEGTPSATPPYFMPAQASDSGSVEQAMWVSAQETLKTSGIQQALAQLFGASCSAPSVRERTRYRLLMARLCLKAARPDLARPIAEELHAAIADLNLERWESPVWIAEVLDALYQCLTTGDASDDDLHRADELFQRLCTTDVTKAMIYHK